MKKLPTHSIIALRLAMGWMMFYAGITKVLNPEWSAEGYLANAKSLNGFYDWLTQPELLTIVNQLNQWGLTLLGISLILGLFTRLSSSLGAILMLLYYIPALDFPYVGEHSYLIDEHIVYALLLLFFVCSKAGRSAGLDSFVTKSAFFKKHKKLLSFLS